MRPATLDYAKGVHFWPTLLFALCMASGPILAFIGDFLAAFHFLFAVIASDRYPEGSPALKALSNWTDYRITLCFLWSLSVSFLWCLVSVLLLWRWRWAPTIYVMLIFPVLSLWMHAMLFAIFSLKILGIIS